MLQDLNPIPFPVVVANCVAWVAYAIVCKDPYVFLANDPGLLLGLFYTLSAYGYADVKVLFCPPHNLPCLYCHYAEPSNISNRCLMSLESHQLHLARLDAACFSSFRAGTKHIDAIHPTVIEAAPTCVMLPYASCNLQQVAHSEVLCT